MAATALVNTLNPPWIEPAGITTPLLTLAMPGWLLVSESSRSVDGGVATVTRPNELPLWPTTWVGVSVSVAGG